MRGFLLSLDRTDDPCSIPATLLVSAYYVRKWYQDYRLKNYGIGKGGKCSRILQVTLNTIAAPGFQTNVKKVRVTPEIAARLRRGENVTPEEIAEASRKADEDEENGKTFKLPPRIIEERDDRDVASRSYGSSNSASIPAKPMEVDNEWLPDSVKSPKKTTRRKR